MHTNLDPAAAAHIARLRRARRGRHITTIVAAVAAIAAVTVASVFGWQLWGTGLETSRHQAQLLAQLQAGVHVPVTSTRAASEPVEASTIDLPDGVDPAAQDGVDAGAPWALIRIDRPDGSAFLGPYAIIEGVDDHHLATGPGHYPGTPEPGQIGNVGIAGHRSTYGAPFADLDLLADGYTIVLIDRNGTEHRYRWHSTRVVAPDATEVLAPNPTGTGRPTITLTTCHPKRSDRQRLIVHATLVGN